MPEISIDQKVLRKKSEDANDLEIGDIIQQLSITIPDNALGLAAPQIGIHKRIFWANLTSGSYAFINPEITWKSSDKIPSQESCLSLPGIVRCIERYSHIHVSCYKRIDMKTGDTIFDPEPMKLNSRDAIIVQHENDHLNGVLILDHPITMTQEERVHDREKKRAERVVKARENKAEKFMKSIKPNLQKLNTKNQAKKKREIEKAKRQQRTAIRQEKIRVKIQENYKANQSGLFSKNKSAVLDAEIEDKQD